jgi:hypothetical protein
MGNAKKTDKEWTQADQDMFNKLMGQLKSAGLVSKPNKETTKIVLDNEPTLKAFAQAVIKRKISEWFATNGVVSQSASRIATSKVSKAL